MQFNYLINCQSITITAREVALSLLTEDMAQEFNTVRWFNGCNSVLSLCIGLRNT